VSGGLIEGAKANNTELVEFWARTAVTQIDTERTRRLEPLNKAEQELLAEINDAFDKAVRANAMITANLNSIRKVDKIETDMLQAMHLNDVREKIKKGLISASDKAKEATDNIEKYSEKIKSIGKK
jgi:hypothetical protein